MRRSSGGFQLAILCLLPCLPVLTGGCAAAKKMVPYPSARIDGVEVKGITLTSLTLEFRIDVENPYSVDLPILGMRYSLASGGKEFLEGRLEADRSIPANRSSMIPMAVKIPFLELYEVVKDAGPGSTIPYEADLGLDVNAPLLGGVTLPLEDSGEITIPSLP